MSFDAVYDEFWDMLHEELDPEKEFPAVTPLLAHYTSLENLENILKNQEVWLSNPLFMNDLEEVRFGVNAGLDIVLASGRLKSALGTDARAKSFEDSFVHYYNKFGNDEVIDLYVICFSRHAEIENDGRLSMWRGYGQNGNGCALVFDTSKISVVEDSPLALAEVKYQTQDERRAAISEKISAVAGFFNQNDIPDDKLHLLAYALFSRICLYAIFTKHKGFKEEDEWRLVYFRNRDRNNALHKYFSYFHGPKGIQPKLKLPTRAIPGIIRDDFEFSDIIHSIIVGPTASSPLKKVSVERMLRSIGSEKLIECLLMSAIPYRG